MGSKSGWEFEQNMNVFCRRIVCLKASQDVRLYQYGAHNLQAYHINIGGENLRPKSQHLGSILAWQRQQAPPQSRPCPSDRCTAARPRHQKS